MRKIKGVIFDLDGTLIDTLEVYIKAFNRGIERFGLEPISREKLDTFLNQALALETILIEIFPATFQDNEARSQCLAEIVDAYLELQESDVSLRPGGMEVLSQLKETGVKIGIVTGRTTSGETKWLELRRLGIDRFIDCMVTGADAPRKPAPDGIIKCAQQLGLSPAECITVGDSQADIITGKAAGTITVAIAGGVATEEALRQEKPDYIISNLAQLPSLLSSYLN
ncbi:HAD family hydrolase [Chloroflexota bacterium]